MKKSSSFFECFGYTYLKLRSSSQSLNIEKSSQTVVTEFDASGTTTFKTTTARDFFLKSRIGGTKKLFLALNVKHSILFQTAVLINRNTIKSYISVPLP